MEQHLFSTNVRQIGSNAVVANSNSLDFPTKTVGIIQQALNAGKFKLLKGIVRFIGELVLWIVSVTGKSIFQWDGEIVNWLLKFGYILLPIVLVVDITITFIILLKNSNEKILEDHERINILSQNMQELLERKHLFESVEYKNRIHNAFAELCAIEYNSEDDMKPTLIKLQNFSDELCSAFHLKNPYKGKYSVSIKFNKNVTNIKGHINPKKTIFHNVARDRLSKSDRKRDEDKYDEIKHIGADNTAYAKVLKAISEKKADCHYVNNDIESGNNYMSTSQSCYEDNTLPYKSEMVFPIIPFRHKENSAKCKLLGMLCITCDTVDGFQDIETDRFIMLMMVEQLYNVVSKWELTEKIRKQQKKAS